MAGSPKWKIYSPNGEYMGCMKHPEDAAAMVSLQPDGATVRYGHAKKHIVWTQGLSKSLGHDGNAGVSYDETASVMLRRRDNPAQAEA